MRQSSSPRITERPRRVVRIAVFAALLGLFGAMVVPATAQADASFMGIAKTVDGADLEHLVPGDEFTYTIALNCADADCLNPSITDFLPAEFDGFDIVSFGSEPADTAGDLTSTGCVVDPDTGLPTQVTDSCVITRTVADDLGGGAQGLDAGEAFLLTIVIRVPLDLDPTWPSNGQTLTNTADLSWDNGTGDAEETKSDTADVIITVDPTYDVTPSKTWEPASQQFSPGDPSTITIGGKNDSNSAVEQLVLQDPASAPDGATELDPNNPFTITDFTGFGSSDLPAEADTVQVDVYVYDEDTGTWSWKTGEPGAVPELPEGVDPADVGGVRFTYADDVLPGSEASIPLNVVQRATDRNDDSTLAPGASVTNDMSATIVPPGEDPISDDADAPFAITPLDINVEADKTITPEQVPAGTDAIADLTGKNNSNGTVDTLTLSDLDFFDADMLFGGFDSAPVWPGGATAAQIVWYVDGVPQPPVTFAHGDIPIPPPGATITGFSISYTGDIEAGASATAAVVVTPQLDLVDENTPTAHRVNTLDVDGHNAAGSDSDDADAPIDVVYPQLDLDLDKTISPQGAVLPGGSVVAGLPATTGTGDQWVNPDEISITDDWDQNDPDDFWNAFDVGSIAPTQVPPNTTLTVSYQLADGSWATLDVVPPTDSAQSFSLSNAEITARRPECRLGHHGTEVRLHRPRWLPEELHGSAQRGLHRP